MANTQEKNLSKADISFKEIIFSPTGGTKKCADILATRIAGENEVQTVDLCDPKASFTSVPISADDVVLIAVPSYGGRVPGTAAERIAQLRGNGARAILVCVYGNRAYDNTLAELQDVAQKASFRVIAAVAALAEHSIARQVAAGRPDAADEECLQKMADEIKNKLAAGGANVPAIPGNVPEKQTGGGNGMAPSAGDSCTKCGLCAAKCPVNAIDPGTLVADKKKCISCMRCVSVCPQNARKLGVVITSLGGVALGVLCKKRKECELYI